MYHTTIKMSNMLVGQRWPDLLVNHKIQCSIDTLLFLRNAWKRTVCKWSVSVLQNRGD